MSPTRCRRDQRVISEEGSTGGDRWQRGVKKAHRNHDVRRPAVVRALTPRESSSGWAQFSGSWSHGRRPSSSSAARDAAGRTRSASTRSSCGSARTVAETASSFSSNLRRDPEQLGVSRARLASSRCLTDLSAHLDRFSTSCTPPRLRPVSAAISAELGPASRARGTTRSSSWATALRSARILSREDLFVHGRVLPALRGSLPEVSGVTQPPSRRIRVLGKDPTSLFLIAAKPLTPGGDRVRTRGDEIGATPPGR